MKPILGNTERAEPSEKEPWPATDSRPQRFAWAPGAYIRKCHYCEKPFIGDKRAGICAPCAYNDKGIAQAVADETAELRRQLEEAKSVIHENDMAALARKGNPFEATPRTDAQPIIAGNKFAGVPMEFARSLERENAKMQQILMACKDHDNAFEKRIEELTNEIAELSEAHAAEIYAVQELKSALESAQGDKDRLIEALKPFARYAEMRAAKPFKGLADEIHTIHTGTQWEAEITLTHCNAARAAIDSARAKGGKS